LRDLGEHEVKGIARAVSVFELEGAGRVHTRLQAAERRGFSRFVGREAEMRTLDAALEVSTWGSSKRPTSSTGRWCRPRRTIRASEPSTTASRLTSSCA